MTEERKHAIVLANVILTARRLRFSKELTHLKAACALHFAWYNFCRVHSSLRVTPAMAAGISEEVWDL